MFAGPTTTDTPRRIRQHQPHPPTHTPTLLTCPNKIMNAHTIGHCQFAPSPDANSTVIRQRLLPSSASSAISKHNWSDEYASTIITTIRPHKQYTRALSSNYTHSKIIPKQSPRTTIIHRITYHHCFHPAAYTAPASLPSDCTNANTIRKRRSKHQHHMR